MSIRKYVEERDARLLFVVRNPDHVVDSMIRRDGYSEKRAIVRWTRGIRELYTAYRAFADRIHVASFEEVVEQPEAVMRRVSSFLGVDYAPEMLDGYQFTPQYNQDGIDSEAAEKSVRDYNVQSNEPASYRQYCMLRDQAV